MSQLLSHVVGVVGACIGLILRGILYQLKPGLFQRGIWKHTAISQRLLTPEQNKIYMRILGGLFVVAGLLMIVFAIPVAHWTGGWLKAHGH